MCRSPLLSVALFFLLLTGIGPHHFTEARGAEPKTELKVVTDRPEAIYKAGEAVNFQISLLRDGQPLEDAELHFLLSLDGAKTISEGKLTSQKEPVKVTGSLDKPGFLRCTVTWKTGDKANSTALAGAAIDPQAIPPSLPVPDDFDAFWDEQKKQLATVALAPVLTPIPSPSPDIASFDVQIPCIGPGVSGYYSRPSQAKPKSCPAVLYVHGAGVRSSVQGSANGAAKLGRLGLDINAHGIPNGKPDTFYAELANGELKDYRYAGRESRDTSYFRLMYLRLIRALDFLTAQPEWDGKVLVVTGHSQGGGQSIVAAGIDPRVTGFATGVPAMCDHSGEAAGRINGWPRLVPRDSDGKPNAKILEASRYVDAMNFATRTKAEAIFSVGFIDTVCPPTSVYAAYNNVSGKKEMVIEPLMGHAAPPKIMEQFNVWIAAHIERVHGRSDAAK